MKIDDFKCQLREILSEGYVNSKIVLKIENLLEKLTGKTRELLN
jgi:hypothetical protein